MPTQRPVKVIRHIDKGRKLTIERSIIRVNTLIANMARYHDDKAKYHAWALKVMRSALRKAARDLTVIPKGGKR